MKVMPIRYVANVEATEQFDTALGLTADQRSRSGTWLELQGSGGIVALQTATAANPPRPLGDVDLCFATDEPLEAVVARLDASGVPHEDITDENFGRLLRTTDPDGLVIQVNEHDPSLYIWAARAEKSCYPRRALPQLNLDPPRQVELTG